MVHTRRLPFRSHLALSPAIPGIHHPAHEEDRLGSAVTDQEKEGPVHVDLHRRLRLTRRGAGGDLRGCDSLRPVLVHIDHRLVKREIDRRVLALEDAREVRLVVYEGDAHAQGVQDILQRQGDLELESRQP